MDLIQNLRGLLAEKNHILNSLRHKANYNELNLSEISLYDKPDEKTPKRSSQRPKTSFFKKTAARPERLKF